MREPYRTIVGHHRDHVLLGPYLEEDEPDFTGLAASDVPFRVSSSELLMLRVALAFHNGDKTATLAEILNRFDYDNLIRVSDAIRIWAGMHR